MIATLFFAWLFQAGLGWRLDLISFAVGLSIGVLVATLVARAIPRLRQIREESVSRVQETQAWVRAGVEARYQTEVALYVRTYHLGRRWAAIDEIFVFPRLIAPRPEPEPTPESLRQPDTIHLAYLWPVLAAGVGTPPVPDMSLRRLLLNGRRVLLTAPDGAGKTTLLAYCANICAEATDTGPFTFLLPFLPVFVHLAELDLDSERAVADPAAPLADVLQRRAGQLTAPGIGALLDEKLADGHVLLLLDGLDELHGGRWLGPAAWLRRLLTRYPKTRVVASGPVTGYEPLLALKFTITGLVPWRAHQVETLASAWSDVLAKEHPPHVNAFWQPGRSPIEATFHLWRMMGLASAGEPPESMAALLEEILRVHLPHDPESTALPAAARQLWENIAHCLVADARLKVDRQTVNREIEALEEQPGVDSRVAQKLRASLQDSGLFVHWSDRSLSFLSPIWRDFFAAGYLVKHKSLHDVIEHLEDPGWAGTVRFFTGLAGESGLTQWLLDPRSTDPLREQLFQAASWLPEVQDGGEWRRQTLIQLGQLIVKPNIPAIVRLRAVAAIAQSAESGVLALLRQLVQRDDSLLRQAAAAGLARFDPEVSVAILEPMLGNEDERVRLATVHALGWQNSARAERPLLTALIGRDEAVSRAVAKQMALNGGEGWDILREAAADDEIRVRRTAVQGLMALDEYWAVQLLERMEIDDEEWVVRSAASLALEAIADRNQVEPWLPKLAGDLTWLVEWAASKERSVPAGTGALPLLLEVLAKAPEEGARVAAAHSLAYIIVPPANRTDLREALQTAAEADPSSSVRDAAYASMASLHCAAGLQKK